MRKLSEQLEGTFANIIFKHKPPAFVKLFLSWRAIVTPEIAAICTPSNLNQEKQILFLRSTQPEKALEVYFMHEYILGRCNMFLLKQNLEQIAKVVVRNY